MAPTRTSPAPAGSPGTAAAAPEDKKPAGTPTDIALGITQILPANGLPGTLIPELVLQFDPRPDDVTHALGNPKALTLTWPIKGKVANLRNCKLPCQVQWQVEYDDRSPARTTNAIGEGAVIKIDGEGRLEVLVGHNPPVLDFIAAGIVGAGSVGFTVVPSEPPGAHPQPCPPEGKAKFQALACSVRVKPDPEANPMLGDKVTYSFTVHELYKKTSLSFYVVEQDVADQKGGGDKEAWKRDLVPGSVSDAAWTIGYADSSGNRFSYAEEFEEGGFEFGWEIRAKCPSQPDKPPMVLVSSKEPLKVAKPQLTKFQVTSADYDKGSWHTEGIITGFSANGPRVRIALALVDREGRLYPADLADATQVVLERDGKFKAALAGPKVAPPAPGQTLPPTVFAVLSLVATWESREKQNPISDFLGYDKNQYALFEKTHKTGWDLSAAWLCSEKSDEIAPRPKERKGGGGGFLAPPPSAGDPQDSKLTINEIAADLVASEGDVPYMYLDCYGYVTVGIGTCLVPGDKKVRRNQLDPSMALKLPFKNREPGRPEKAEEEDIRTAFGNVARMEKNRHPADKYLTHPHLELEHKDVLAEVQKYVDEAERQLKNYLPGYETFPKAARRAILDIVYNRGVGHFGPKKNYEIRKAVLVRDWKHAAEHVPRDGQASRRQWRLDCFAYAQAYEDSKKTPTS